MISIQSGIHRNRSKRRYIPGVCEPMDNPQQRRQEAMEMQSEAPVLMDLRGETRGPLRLYGGYQSILSTGVQRILPAIDGCRARSYFP